MPNKKANAASTLKERLSRARRYMTKAGITALFVPSTDRYLNEYVPKATSFRQWLTGFTGSTGDALITRRQAFLVVDARYWQQAEKEVDAERWTVHRAQGGHRLDQATAQLLTDLAGRGIETIGFATESMTPARLEQLRKGSPDTEWVPLETAPASKIRRPDEEPPPREVEIAVLDESGLGSTAQEKLALVSTLLGEVDADALVVQRLDQLMWLSNLRGSELPNQSTFTGIGLATSEHLYIGVTEVPDDDVLRTDRPTVSFLPEADLWSLVADRSDLLTVAYDPTQTTVQVEQALHSAGVSGKRVSSILDVHQARKSPEELAVMRYAFHRADCVMAESIRWLNTEVRADRRVTEAQLANEVYRRFIAAGATGLSFSTICAAGKNGALMHYGPPSSRRVIKRGELVLIDTGAYFDEGYATDLTRTFVAGAEPGTDTQRTLYTHVLKAAIAGMTAVLPLGARGSQLDAIVRAPLWEAGLDFGHGTGHGVGINVHEFPPRIGPNSQSELEIGHVFSIEPGYYEARFGGIRIENVCTLVPDAPGFMKVAPLTFAPLDAKLIVNTMLSPKEKTFVKWFGHTYREQKKLV